MRLSDYAHEYIYAHIPMEAQGLHVIGTCGECKFKKNYPVPESLDEGENVCKHPENWVENGFPDDFGCIHFEKK